MRGALKEDKNDAEADRAVHYSVQTEKPYRTDQFGSAQFELAENSVQFGFKNSKTEPN